jgi:hypothetical protein
MADISPDNLRGIAIPLRINNDWIWTTEATYTQQGNRTGVPVPQQPDGVILTGHGQQTANTSFEIETQQGGSVGDRATFIWREGGTGDYYGHDNAGAISHSENVRFNASAAALYPDCVTLDDGSVLACYQVNTGKQIYVAKWTAAAGWTETLLLTFSVLTFPGMGDLYPTICKLSDGSLLIAYWFSDSFAGVASIRTLRSTDDGATWSAYSDDCLRDSVNISGSVGPGNSGFDLRRLRMRAINGQVLLVAEVLAHNTSIDREQAYQYASTNNGATFEYIDLINSTNGDMQNVQSPDITVLNGVFYVAFADDTTATPKRLYVMPLTNAFESINSAWAQRTEVATNVNTATQGHVALWTDDNGFIYAAYGSDIDNRTRISVSTDANDTWAFFSENLYRTDTSTEALTFATGCATQGRNILITQVQSTVGTIDNGIFGHWLGGYSNVTLPGTDAVSLAIYDWSCFNKNWTGFWLPDDGTWTKSGSGGGTITAAGMDLTTTTSTSTLCLYSVVLPISSAEQGYTIRVRLTATNGGTDASNRRIVRLRYHDGTTHEITLRMATGSYRVYDGNSVVIGSTINVDMTNGVDFLISLANGQFSIWHRISNLDGSVRTWTNDFNGVSVPAGGTASNALEFGHQTTASSGTTDTTWHELHYSFGNETGNIPLASGFNNPNDLHGNEYPKQGSAVYIDEGVSISTFGGFAGKGEQNVIDTRYLYPIENAFYSYSATPRMQWRSTKGPIISNVPEQFIPIYSNLAVGSNEETRLDSDLLCFDLQNINFAEFDIEYYDGAAWQVAASIDTRKTSTFNRSGANVRHKTGGAFAGYYHFDDLAGGFVVLGSRSTGKIRQIEGNTEGVWDESSTGKQAVLTLADIDGSELATGAIEIYPNKCTVVISQLSIDASAWGIRIKTNKTTTGDFRIGNLTIAPVYIFAPQYGRGRSIEFEPNTETFIQTDGTQRTRFRSEGRQTVQINFSDGVDTTGQFSGSTRNFDFYAAENTNDFPVANFGDVPYSMLNIVKRVAGSRDAIVYLPRIPYANNTAEETRVLTGKNDSMLMTIDSNITIRNVLGDEFEDDGGELLRVSTITLRQVE